MENIGYDRAEMMNKSLYEQALYVSLTDEEREQLEKSREKATKSQNIFDAVNNMSQNWGGGTSDFTYNGMGQFSRRGLSWQIQKQDSIMRDIPYFEKASSWKATMALRNGIDLNSKEDTTDDLLEIQNDLITQFSELHSGIRLGDFYGGSGLIMYVKGVETFADYAKPLNVNKIKKGEFLGLKPLSRLYQIHPDLSSDLVVKVGEEYGIYDANEIGQPLYYMVNLSGDSEAKQKYFKVHRSRLLIYNSMELSWVEKRIEMYFGPSLLERSYSDFARYESMLSQINKLAQRSNIPILNVQNLPQASLNGQRFAEFVTARIKGINFSASSGNMIVLGDIEKEQFKFESANFAELTEILKHYRQNLSASLEAPTGVLFNDNSEDDLEKYLTKIREIQERVLRKWFRKLIPLLYKSRFGKQLKDFTFKFKSLENPTEKEKADKLKTVVETLDILYNSNVIDVDSYQRMFKASQDNVTDIPNEMSKEYLEFVKQESQNGKPLNKMRMDIELATVLNHNQGDGESSGQSNKVESALKGTQEGGNQKKTKKPTVKVPIVNKKE